MPDSVLQHRPLESALFGHTVYSCTVTTPSEAGRALAAAKSVGPSLLVFRAPASSLSTVQVVEAAGGRLCDILLTYARVAPLEVADVPHSEFGLRIRLGAAEDSVAIRTIAARAFSDFGGHWHADPRLDSQLATRLYTNWAADLAIGSGTDTHILVAADSAGQLAGFLAAAVDGKGNWSVPLTAVDPDYRGLGILSALLRAALRAAAESGAAKFQYETQSENRPALRVIGRQGFLLQSTRLTLHLWTENA